MAIIQSEDGYITFSIPTDAKNPDIVLPTLSEIIDLMNNYAKIDIQKELKKKKVDI